MGPKLLRDDRARQISFQKSARMRGSQPNAAFIIGCTRAMTFFRPTRAREERADRLFEELFEIADKPCTNQVEVQQQRNRLDTRKWALSKLTPSRYGDRVEHDVKGGGFQPAVLIQIGDGAPEPVDVSGKVIAGE